MDILHHRECGKPHLHCTSMMQKLNMVRQLIIQHLVYLHASIDIHKYEIKSHKTILESKSVIPYHAIEIQPYF